MTDAARRLIIDKLGEAGDSLHASARAAAPDDPETAAEFREAADWFHEQRSDLRMFLRERR